MRKLSSLLAVLLIAGAVHAQHLNTVTESPTPPNECVALTYTFSGTMTQQGVPDHFTYDITGNTITMDVFYTGSGGGNSNFSQPIGVFGPYAPGVYTFVGNLLYNNAPAGSVTFNFTVQTGPTPDLGGFGEEEVCNTAASFPLLDVLTGTPDAGGVWRDPNNNVVPNGIFDPGFSPEGYYVYQFDLLAPCVVEQQLALMTYTPNNNPGIDATTQICTAANADPVDLFTRLAGSPESGGTWTGPSGAAHSNMYVPGVDGPGVYTYTITGVAPCGDPSAKVTVQPVQPNNAGTGSNIELCYNDVSEVLSSHVTGEQTSGSWFSAGGFPVGGYNAQINCSLNGAGPYYYIVTSALCPADTATVNVTLNGPPCTISIEERSGNISRFELMPNPATDEVTVDIELAHPAQAHTLEIIDVNGRVMHSEVILFNGVSTRRTIDVAGFAGGAYLIRLSSADGTVVKRLMVR